MIEILTKDELERTVSSESGSIYRDRSEPIFSKGSVSWPSFSEVEKPSITSHIKNKIYATDFGSISIEEVTKVWRDKKGWTPDRVQLRINDVLHFLPKELIEVANQIEEAKEVLAYSDNWNGDGAVETDKQTFGEAATFVVSYANWVYEYSGAVLKTPYIDIMLDGAISVLWETEKAKLFIIFNKEENLNLEEKKLAYFYAVNNQTEIPFKSAVDPNAPVDEILGQWMEKNLT